MTHWKKLNNPDYLGAYALDEGQELTITIDYVTSEMVKGKDGKSEERIVAHFKERDVKPMILNATNCKTIAKIYNTPYIEKWGGKRITVFATMVSAFGDTTEALRIRPFAPKDEKYYCDECGEEITKYGKKSARDVAADTTKRFGRPLCIKHAQEAAEAAKKNEGEGDVLGESERGSSGDVSGLSGSGLDDLL